MTHQSVPGSESSGFVSRPAHTETRLRGRALALARGVWFLFTMGMLANFIASIPVYYLQQHVICDVPVHCIEADQASPSKLLALERLGLSLDDFALYSVCLQIAIALVCLATGALIFWRKSNTWQGLWASFFLVLVGCSGTFESLAGAWATANSPLALRLLALLVHGAELPALGIFLLIFPTGRFTPRWSWVVSVWWTAHILSFNLPAPYNFNYWPPVLQASDFLLLVASPIPIQVYRYRHVYTPTERQQTKWLVSGFVGGVLLLLFFDFVLPIVPGLNAPDSPLQLLDSVGGALLFISIPVGVGIAILRYRLWDIDVLINKALAYGLLTALLGALYAGLIIGLSSLASAMTGQRAEQPVAVVVSTLATAALFQPLRRRIQTFIDRRFYRQKYDAEKILAAFSARLSQEVDLSQLSEQLLAVVQETMQPTSLSLWLCPRKPEVKPGKAETRLPRF